MTTTKTTTLNHGAHNSIYTVTDTISAWIAEFGDKIPAAVTAIAGEYEPADTVERTYSVTNYSVILINVRKV